MAKTRMINTRFWNDTFISHLDPIEKLLFIYFITNEHTNICGIYELPLKIAAIETGIDSSMFEKVLPRLAEKIVYIDGWVVIKNFTKHQSGGLPKVQKGIQLALDSVPANIVSKALAIGYKAIYNNTDIGNGLGTHTQGMYSDSDSDSDFITPVGVKKESIEAIGLDSVLSFSLSLEDWRNHEGYIEVETYGGEEVGEITAYAHPSRKKPYSREELEKKYQAYVRSLAPKTRKPLDHYDFQEALAKLKNSSNKTDKIIALVWYKKGYDFDNYAQWMTQFNQDKKFARMLEGYTGEDISRAIELCEEESGRQGYEWKMSTVVKKIAEVKKRA